MKKKYNSIIESAVKKYGTEEQMRMLEEECAELIVATSHFLRGRESGKDEVVEEIADVLIMCEQIILALNIAHSVNFTIEHKLMLLASRLK